MKGVRRYLPGFHHLFGRRPKSEREKYAERIKSIRESVPGQLAEVFGKVIPPESIPLAENSRQRIFCTRTTFWAFLSQVLRGGSQRAAVREVQAMQIGRASCRERGGLSGVAGAPHRRSEDT